MITQRRIDTAQIMTCPKPWLSGCFSIGERAGRRLAHGIRLPDGFWIIALYVVAVITRLTFRRLAG
jgi:hypothetical protein